MHSLHAHELFFLLNLNSSGAFLSRLFHVLTTWNWIVSLQGSHRLCSKILSIILLSVTFEKKKGIWEKNYAKNFHHVQLNLEKFEGYDLRRNGLRYFPRLCDKHRIVNKSNL